MMNRYLKNILVTFLSLNVFLASVGIPVYKHYCNDKLIGLQYLVEQENYCHLDHGDEKACCANTETENHEKSCCSTGADCNDCCENELELVKIDLQNVHKTVNHLSQNFQFTDILPVYFQYDCYSNTRDLPEKIFENNIRSGPLLDGQCRVISFQKFIC